MVRILLLSNPRSGSTYLRELMNSHSECNIGQELINSEVQIDNDPLSYIDNQLSNYHETIVGFKLFTEHIFERNLDFLELVKHIHVTHIVVLWRENVLETLTSLEIAFKTGEWYTNERPRRMEVVTVAVDRIESFKESIESQWIKIGEQWPSYVEPIFVKYEELIKDSEKCVRYIFSRLSLCTKNASFRSSAQKQNPAELSKKILNWSEIPKGLQDLKLDVPTILSKQIGNGALLPEDLKEIAPHSEPKMPPEGWRYRVADPFIPTQMKQNVFDAISSGSISSAGLWPRVLSMKLKQLFQAPVVQPCSNGFSALLLALQTVKIGKEDEVILPSMTMVAVANAVAFLGARPVFVDSAKDNYNPGWKEIQCSITQKTKAVIITHTYGVPTPNLLVIANECKQRGLWFIEDISECVGVKEQFNGSDRMLGTFGDFACASMYVNKIIHSGDGGFVVAKDPKFSSRLSSLVNHGFTQSYHFVHFEMAANCKMNGVGAAMACGCIDEIGKVLKHRQIVAETYRTQLKNLPIKLMPRCGPYDTPWVFGIECESKNVRMKLREYLAENGIETRDFFFPLHLQPAFRNLQVKHQRKFDNAEKFGSTGFYLPTHSNLLNEDIEYITSVVKNFFSPNVPIQPMSTKKPKVAVQLIPDSFRVEVRSYDESGHLQSTGFRNHIYYEAVRLAFRAEACLVHEKWDEMILVISNIDALIDDGKKTGVKDLEDFFSPYMKYFKSQLSLEQSIVKPWMQINLELPEYALAKNIPSTTDLDTLQLLILLVQETKPKIILELGCWLGHATHLMALAGRVSNSKIFACDAFKWQNWMRTFCKEIQLNEGDSFQDLFLTNTGNMRDIIEPVTWPYNNLKLPQELTNQKFNLIFLDMTQDEKEIEIIWQLVKPNCIVNETLLVFNGLSLTSIPFFIRNSKQLIPIIKPNTIAKVFKYVGCSKPANIHSIEHNEIPRKLCFVLEPAWEHHNQNLFCQSINLLRSKLHSSDADILFIPAVEESICDNPQIFVQPWIGIIHSVVQHKELFYTPDLQRLCSPRYAKLMNQCRGLFTLTKLQAEYLRENLFTDIVLPIQSLKYPTPINEDSLPSNVPQLWRNNTKVDLIFIGSFARDFDYFFQIEIPHQLRKVLLVGDCTVKEAAKRAPNNVFLMNRLSENEYEKVLRNSVIFLALKYDGAANTLILECIARNLPILAPRHDSCVEYLGENYPLLYNHNCNNLEELLTLESIEKAIKYLELMDKGEFHIDKFIQSIKNGAVMMSLPPSSKLVTPLFDNGSVMGFPRFDVTISICSYRRTHNLQQILESLWNNQNYNGNFQIIIWNNNECRRNVVQEICSSFIQKSSNHKSLEVISSTRNHYCSIRLAMPQLMQSDYLLICDDDCIPNENFISFFISAKNKYPRDILCLRGHKFSPHELDLENPSKIWHEYDNLRFYGDETPETQIHFFHADACLIPKQALEEVASVGMSESSFKLVDDYWMSFILNHKFGRKLRKLSTSTTATSPITRTADSDTIGLALHTRPEVQQARDRLYIHHMLQGWPSWQNESALVSDTEGIKNRKMTFWNRSAIGYNVSSEIDENGIADLVKLGVSCVRIGAVGVGRKFDFELSGFMSESVDEIEDHLCKLSRTIDLLSAANISSVLTLDRRIASVSTWRTIASHFSHNPFLVGYDLINEPFTAKDNEMCWFDAALIATEEYAGVDETIEMYLRFIQAIREVDKITPIIVEPTFWAHLDALEKLPIDRLLSEDDNLIVSFHFYEPMALTHRTKNKNRFEFPGAVPIYDNSIGSETIFWNENLIRDKFQLATAWSQKHSVKLFLGEFGISRNIRGADEYLRVILTACKDFNIIGFLFSFRDPDWESLDYELGKELTNFLLAPDWNDDLMKVIIDGIKNCAM